jgi:putative transposase
MAVSVFAGSDYRTNNKCKVMTLDADEFIRRFLLHTLPKGFRRIRHFGFLANACRASKLARIRTALNVPKPAATVEPADYRERYAILTGHRIDLCPVCAGRMVEIGRWPRSASPEDIRAKALIRATRPTAREPLRAFHQGFAPHREVVTFSCCNHGGERFRRWRRTRIMALRRGVNHGFFHDA